MNPVEYRARIASHSQSVPRPFSPAVGAKAFLSQHGRNMNHADKSLMETAIKEAVKEYMEKVMTASKPDAAAPKYALTRYQHPASYLTSNDPNIVQPTQQTPSYLTIAQAPDNETQMLQIQQLGMNARVGPSRAITPNGVNHLDLASYPPLASSNNDAQPQSNHQQSGRMEGAKKCKNGRPLTSHWLAWPRARTPFCVNERELRTQRHQQNPQKPPPSPLPHEKYLLKHARPHTAMGQMSGQPYEADCTPKIKGWIEQATNYEKQVIANVMKVLDENKSVVQYSLQPHSFTFGRSTRPKSSAAQLDSVFMPDLRTYADGADDKSNNCQRKKVSYNKDYVHPGHTFLNVQPTYRGHFIIHPDWVSETRALNYSIKRRNGKINRL